MRKQRLYTRVWILSENTPRTERKGINQNDNERKIRQQKTNVMEESIQINDYIYEKSHTVRFALELD